MNKGKKKTLALNGWIARDEDGYLHFFSKEPHKHEGEPNKHDGTWFIGGGGVRWFIAPENDVFGDDIKWEDEKALMFNTLTNIEYTMDHKKKE